MGKRFADNVTVEDYIRLRKDEEVYKKALQTIIDLAEDPLIADNPHIVAYIQCARIAQEAFIKVTENYVQSLSSKA